MASPQYSCPYKFRHDGIHRCEHCAYLEVAVMNKGLGAKHVLLYIAIAAVAIGMPLTAAVVLSHLGHRIVLGQPICDK